MSVPIEEIEAITIHSIALIVGIAKKKKKGCSQ